MANKMLDIALDGDDLKVTAGDFVSEECTRGHQKELFLNNKGDFKQFPTTCVGAEQYQEDDDLQGFLNAISDEFSKDGMDVESVTMNGSGQIVSKAEY